MMRGLFVVTLLCSVISAGWSSGQPVPRDYFEPGLAFLAGSNPHLVPRAELALEKRRAGGARPEVISRLLRKDHELKDPEWLSWVLEECTAGRLRCADFVEPALHDVEIASPLLQQRARHRLQLLQEESEWQARTTKARRSCIEHALTSDLCRDFPPGLRSHEAARRALDERFLDLIPVIEKASRTWPGHNWAYVSCRLEVLRARGSVSPVDGLLGLIEESVSYDVKVAATLNPYELAPNVETRIGLLVPLSLDELRNIDPPNIAPRLKGIMAKYERVRQLSTPESGSEAARVATERSHSASGLGRLGELIVEAIGDFGDRGFERMLLNGTCLFDQVARAEQELITKGLLAADEAIAKPESR